MGSTLRPLIFGLRRTLHMSREDPIMNHSNDKTTISLQI
jgi:hypothetical protein